MNRMIYRLLISIIIPLIYSFSANSQPLEYTFNLSEMFPVHDFRLENSDGLKIQSINKDGDIDKSIEGIYTFVINGYIEKIKFKNGEAPLSDNFNSSEIFYIKHEKSSETVRHLYYAINGWTIPIPFWLLIIIPVMFIILAMFIKRILFIILLIGFILFFVLQGMDVSSFINLIKEAVSHLIS